MRDKKLTPWLLSFSEVNQDIIRVIRRDVAYLKARGLLDYSLLMCVENSQEEFNPVKIVEERRLTQVAMRKHQEKMAHK